jgi:hypothetical protein
MAHAVRVDPRAHARPRARAQRRAPGPPLALCVQTALFWTGIDRFLRVCAERYGDSFTVRVFPWGEVLVVSDPADLRKVFAGDPGAWRAGESYDLLR